MKEKKNLNGNNRLPIVYKNKQLMPMLWAKARKWAKQGKLKIKYNKDGILYGELKYEPSGFDIQEIIVGIDPGSCFDGISVVSKECHHENIELLHPVRI